MPLDRRPQRTRRPDPHARETRHAGREAAASAAARPSSIADWSASLHASEAQLGAFDAAIGRAHDALASADAARSGGALQLREAGATVGARTADAHAVAQAGLRGGGRPLPHAERIQAAFGRHDIGGVRSFVGGAATTASQRLGASGFAMGDAVAFAREPDLRLAAHEAAHVVQQRGGVSLMGGVGSRGDVYERHADEVADAVSSGRSAEGLLDRMAPRGASHAGRPAVQRDEPGSRPEDPAPTSLVIDSIREMRNLAALNELRARLCQLQASDREVVLVEVGGSFPVRRSDLPELVQAVAAQRDEVRRMMTPEAAAGPRASDGPISTAPARGRGAPTHDALATPATQASRVQGTRVSGPIPASPSSDEFDMTMITGISGAWSREVSWTIGRYLRVQGMNVSVSFDNCALFTPRQQTTARAGRQSSVQSGGEMGAGDASQSNRAASATQSRPGQRWGDPAAAVSHERSTSIREQLPRFLQSSANNLSLVGAGQLGFARGSGGTGWTGQAGVGLRFENTTFGQFNANFNLIEISPTGLSFGVFHFVWDSPHWRHQYRMTDGSIVQGDLHMTVDFAFGPAFATIARDAVEAALVDGGAAATTVASEGRGAASATTAAVEGAEGAGATRNAARGAEAAVEGANALTRGAQATEVVTEGANAVRAVGTMTRAANAMRTVGSVSLVFGRALLRAIPETILIELMTRGVIALVEMRAYDEYERPALMDERYGPRITRGLAEMTANITRVMRGETTTGPDGALAMRAANDQIQEWLAHDSRLSRADIAANFREPGMWRGIFDAIAPAWRAATDRRALELCPRPRETPVLVEHFRRRIEAARAEAGGALGA